MSITHRDNPNGDSPNDPASDNPNSDNVVTRQRLLESAGEVFADLGFRNATIRDICKRAGANVAAVSYHFGDKEHLYAAAVRFAHDCAKRFPVDGGLSPDATPEQRLHAFIRAFLMGILDDGRPAWHGKLMAREMNDPTGVLDAIVAEGIRPRFEMLSSILRQIAGDDVPSEQLERCAGSIVGQILFYHFASPVLKRLFPGRPLDASAVDTLADHITAFSLRGLDGLQNGKAVEGGTR